MTSLSAKLKLHTSHWLLGTHITDDIISLETVSYQLSVIRLNSNEFELVTTTFQQLMWI
ncbi:hypothetical protein ACE1AT_01800 [Pelatocladus sp. BLCC-F211]|uniref:hypothetical protein n=1 Tax=Pelatocladus sp. BLCC-F211 TaxID=3342752 RepID=UPI0035B7527F